MTGEGGLGMVPIPVLVPPLRPVMWCLSKQSCACVVVTLFAIVRMTGALRSVRFGKKTGERGLLLRRFRSFFAAGL